MSQDRRSATNGDGGMHEAGDTRKVDIRSDGTLRRAGAGSRSFSDYFKEHREPVRRGELLGFMEMIEYHRRESMWFVRLWRWLWRQPAPWNLPEIMANRFEKRTIVPATAAVATELEKSPAPNQAVRRPPANPSGGGSLITRPDGLPPHLHKIGETDV